PLDKGEITKDKFTGDIGQLASNELLGRENDEEIILFETVGIAAQDLTTAKSIFTKVQEND
ncbi:MAG: ornithine cyclodeaminase family protein, partial [Tetragenococcus koreensis]|nr:ornithine cyclodeaminase family protein [Tetragenococcus koreensis]